MTSGASGTETDSKAEAILDVLYLQKIRNTIDTMMDYRVIKT